MNLVYTAIYGGYDKLWQPKEVAEGWEYRCYTDRKIEGGAWNVVGKKLPDVSDAKASKYVKITHPMQHFKNILWIDGCVEIKGDLNKFIKELPDGDMVIAKHPFNNNVDDELKACISMKKDDVEIMKQQIKGYGKIKPYIHTQNTVILRRKNIPFSDMWWNEVKKKSKRDQLSFGYAIQQSDQKYNTVPWSLIEKYFNWHKYHDK